MNGVTGMGRASWMPLLLLVACGLDRSDWLVDFVRPYDAGWEERPGTCGLDWVLDFGRVGAVWVFPSPSSSASRASRRCGSVSLSYASFRRSSSAIAWVSPACAFGSYLSNSLSYAASISSISASLGTFRMV